MNLYKYYFILTSLVHQAKEMSQGNSDKNLNKFRKTLKILLKFKSDKVLFYLETHLLKNKSLPEFFILLEELTFLKKDTSVLEDSFIKLINLSNFDYISVEKFLNIISKDRTWLINKLLYFSLFEDIRHQINEVAIHDLQELNNIVQCIIEKAPHINEIQYNNLLISILNHSDEFTEILLRHKNLNIQLLETNIIFTQKNSIIKNYSNYLFNKNKDSFIFFERKFINHTQYPLLLLEYANTVNFSSKRLILKKLTNLQAEKELVRFIKMFPEYNNLIPLL